MTKVVSTRESLFLTEFRNQLDLRHIPQRDDCHDGNKCHLLLDCFYVCLSCDGTPLLEHHRGKRPDFLIAAHANPMLRIYWIVVEMKSTWVNDGAVERQLSAAKAIIDEFTPPIPSNAKLIRLLLHSKNDRRVASIVSKNRPVQFRGARVRILPMPCGTALSEIINT